jgi:cation diffusion facilitator family transporter
VSRSASSYRGSQYLVWHPVACYAFVMTAGRTAITRFAWLSIVAAIVTIGMKAGAYALTGSVGLLSDALESVVNLVAAIVALIALTVAHQEPDEEHAYGHQKAEYFASGTEGGLILLAAASIAYAAIDRLLHPQPVEAVGLGLVISTLASLVNLGVALRLRRAAREYRSITLDADAKHLLTDVWTSVGVIIGVAAVAITGWGWLDAALALAVAANIVWSGVQLLRRSALGLLDTALPTAEVTAIREILDRHAREAGVDFHALRTREAGARRFASTHILVPGHWTVQRGHILLEQIELELRIAVPGLIVFTHLEPLGDPASHADLVLDRALDYPASIDD